MVVVCFTIAGLLISKSYYAWQDAPVSTSITTLPISDLDFPTVTVCPPKDSHTALNYDLMKADNNSLTEQDRGRLKDVVKEILVLSLMDDVQEMQANLNKESAVQMLKGYQTLPKAYGLGKFEITLLGESGSHRTPGFGESYQEDYHNHDKDQHFILELPQSALSLRLQLEVDTRVQEGWREEAAYSAGSRFRLYNLILSWQYAEAHCQAEGGHLASVRTEEEQQEVIRLKGGRRFRVWLGGSDLEKEGSWRWTDGFPWGYTRGFREPPAMCTDCKRHCLLVDDENIWQDAPCDTRYAAKTLCQIETVMVGKSNLSLNLSRSQLVTRSIWLSSRDICDAMGQFHVWYRYSRPSHNLIDSWQQKRPTGFRLTWVSQMKADEEEEQDEDKGYD